MKLINQAYQTQIDQLDSSLKISKKKQLTFKAKTKCLEKQLESLKNKVRIKNLVLIEIPLFRKHEILKISMI